MADTSEATIPEFKPSPEFLARAQRVQDALELKQPDRIPVLVGLGYLLADMGEVSGPAAKTVFEEMFYTGKKPGEVIVEKGLNESMPRHPRVLCILESLSC